MNFWIGMIVGSHCVRLVEAEVFGGLLDISQV